MRTQEQFAAIFKDVQWFVKFHNKPVWLVALDDKYAISVIKPRADEIDIGTVANLYGVDMDIIDSVVSEKGY